MNERLPSPAEVLYARTSRPADVGNDASAVAHKLLDLADRGDYIEAAARAAELLHGACGDVRLISVYLAGLFVERGVPGLPAVLDVVENLGDDRSRRTDAALEWLLRAIVDRVAYHTTRRDAAWDSWLRELSVDQVEDIAARCGALSTRLDKGGSAAQKLGRFAREKLLPAVTRARRAAAAAESVAPQPAPDPEPRTDRHAPDPEAVSDHDDDEPDDDDPDHDPGHDEPDNDESDDDAPEHDESDDDESNDEPEYEARARRPDAIRRDPRGSHDGMSDSPALAELRDKLLAFEIVLARGELDKAAVVAHDIQAILGNFDPLVYLPALFGRYAELLHGAFAEIEARWHDTGSPQWRILAQFYRTNLAGFVGE